jgi:serine/threonine protein kinase
VVTASSPHALAPGTRVRDYTIISVIGTGGFSIVYKALDNALMREVALKEYFPTSFALRAPDNSIQPHSRDTETFHTGIVSFLNEAKLLAQFDHPALVRVYRYWEENSTAYLAMQLYAGETLREAVQRKHFHANEATMRALFEPLCDTLSLLHEAKCFHRDVAPDNILLGENNVPVLLDFGAARKAIEGTQVFTAILKPGYAPIEQYGESDLKQGPWTDIYALAGVMHFALSGHAPPTAINRVLKDAMPRPRETFAGKMPERWLDAMENALAVRPENRVASIAALRDLMGWDATVVQKVPLATAVAASPPPALPPRSAPPKIHDPDATVVVPQRFRPTTQERVAPAENKAATEQKAQQSIASRNDDPEQTVVDGSFGASFRKKENASELAPAAYVDVVHVHKDVSSPPPQNALATTSATKRRLKWVVPVAIAACIATAGVVWRMGSAPNVAPVATPAIPAAVPAKTPPVTSPVLTPATAQPKAANPDNSTATKDSVLNQKEIPSLTTEPTVVPPVATTAVAQTPEKPLEAKKKATAKRSAEREVDEYGATAAKAKRTRPARCNALVETFQLGNYLSAEDQRYFQENCK